jgi:hypothetical protein
MTIFRSEDGLMGLLSLAVVPWIGSIMYRGLREHRLPIGRGHVLRDERPAAFNMLFFLYAASAILMLLIGLDLLTAGEWGLRR